MIDTTLAFVFPGQGAQAVGMLADVASQYPEIQQTFDEASAVLAYDLWDLVQNGPAEKLDKTTHTQPALLAASYAIWKIFQSRNFPKPAMLAGHSLGEYTALVCANALTFADAIKLVAARGRYMQEAVTEGSGAMAAIVGLEDATVLALCQQAKSADEIASPANYNSLGQVVVAGHRAAVERTIQLAKDQGAKLAMFIPVSVPSHCELMRPAAQRLMTQLATVALQQPQIPVVSNVDVSIYSDAQSIRDGLVRQLYSPVRWVETIQYFVNKGITTIVECGPNKILTGLNKRIDKRLELFPTLDRVHLEAVFKLENEGARNV
ncbi:MAG: ACP S-malonyltransferase [Gammaproteobacteria bacterium]|nr:ACP S-malonyltransferase [Gammaproteobacteria bacterium]